MFTKIIQFDKTPLDNLQRGIQHSKSYTFKKFKGIKLLKSIEFTNIHIIE